MCACGCGKEFAVVHYRRRYYSGSCQARDWRHRLSTPEGRWHKNDRARLDRARLRRIFLAALPAVECAACGEAFKRSRADQMYCSRKCNKRAQYLRRKGRR